MEIKIGDVVEYQNRGKDRLARISTIELCPCHSKRGTPVQSANTCDEIVVTLNDGHWARGNKLIRVFKETARA